MIVMSQVEHSRPGLLQSSASTNAELILLKTHPLMPCNTSYYVAKILLFGISAPKSGVFHHVTSMLCHLSDK